ncbi:MAG TPA: hypothetical protein IAA45_00740 [Candidatus Blautia gallistercoris]|uniref:Uncharacterized protein n=1 Tax=Candidatus Blautia gallistercoris TaxID=2838490 RepID=A0A9D1WHF4_9FIRM|nr:hypothetical protein [Candidatus Blautia gallistercoris]
MKDGEKEKRAVCQCIRCRERAAGLPLENNKKGGKGLAEELTQIYLDPYTFV